MDRYVSVVDAGWQARAYAMQTDVYVSLNAYGRPRRHLAGIRALYVDLDYYKTEAWAGATAWEVLSEVQAVLEAKDIPFPSLAVSTGRGLQLVWLFPPVMLKAGPKAVAANKVLATTLARFGADRACADLARVFRVPGTVNGKNGKLARLLYFDEHYHGFDGLCEAIFGPKVQKAASARRKTRSDKVRRAENRSLVHQRLADLQRIVLGRWSGKVPEGMRNVVAHMAAVHLVQLAGDPHENVAAWCAKWVDGLPPREVKSVTASVLRNKARNGGYRYKGLTIGEHLAVTQEEVSRFGLKSIHALDDAPVEIKARKQARDLDDKRRKRRAAGAKAQAESLSRLEPWKALGISRATYYRRQALERNIGRDQIENTRETTSAPLQ